MNRLLLLSLLLVGCGPAMTEIEMKEVNASGQTGKARLIEAAPNEAKEAQTEIQLDVSKGVNGLYQYLGIYKGSCAKIESLVHRVGQAKDGALASQKIVESLSTLKSGHALVLRKDSRDDSPIASCGDIQ